MTNDELDRLCIDTVRFLSVDAVETANSGHPGLPLDAAPMAYVLWTRFLRHAPDEPTWWDRDRFVLSAGHGSALLYALLHLSGYDLPLGELERFRQWGSRTPGHPERTRTAGVEATTGPLGQGLANAVGMAIAEAHLAAVYNRPGHTIFDHRTFVIASDGDLMEGVTSEASSLAGHLGLGKLIVLYDCNHVSLAGTTSLTFSEDVGRRYRAYGWQVEQVDDGNDVAGLTRAIGTAIEDREHPSLILVDTVIGYGSPGKQGTYQVHGAPLGPEETVATKRNLGWPEAARFRVPEQAGARMAAALDRGRERTKRWREQFARYADEYPELAAELERRFEGDLPEGWAEELPRFEADAEGVATRKASGTVLRALASRLPELVGGSGDLDPSTHTRLDDGGDFESPARLDRRAQGTAGGGWDRRGRNIHFGVREHAMAAAINGIAYHGGMIPFGATFLAFADYMRPAIRLAALSELGAVFVFTHDSIGLGEDGPTHQPIGQLASLRAIPGLLVIRPADANEARVAWQVAVEQRHRPTALVLTRQAVPTLDRRRFAAAEELRHGAYVLDRESGAGEPDIILLASGSEVALAIAAATTLRDQGRRVRVVSMPCWRLFEEQDAGYRASVLPPEVGARLAIEAGSPLGWDRYVGPRGDVIAVDHFGASAPGATVMSEFGFDPENVVRRAHDMLSVE